MRYDALELDSTVSKVLPELRLRLSDVEGIRLVLSGTSVVDWHKAAFGSREEVDRLLRLHLLDVDDTDDRQRLRYVYNEAVAYLEEHLHVTVPGDLRDPTDVRDVFLIASDTTGYRRRQMTACMVLKLMHVLHHLEAADLKHRSPLSEQALLEMAHRRVTRAAHELRASGTPIVAFYGSRKTRASVVSKLLAKRENVATTVFDKLRFRIVVPDRADLTPTLAWLTRHLIPFNHVIPGQSHNNLLDPEELERALDGPDRAGLQPMLDGPVRVATAKNEFSGRTYQMINFIVDLPVRLPDPLVSAGFNLTHGRVVYVMVEFQLVDAETAELNERGENAHALYKRRQQQRVETRLRRGGYVK